MLRDWFSSLPAFAPDTKGNLSTLIDRCQHEILTGVLRLDSLSGELYLWMFMNGEGKSLFKYEKEKWVAFPPSQLKSKLNGCQVNSHLLPVPIQGMRVCDVVLAAEVGQDSSWKMTGTDLLQQVQVWLENSTA